MSTCQKPPLRRALLSINISTEIKHQWRGSSVVKFRHPAENSSCKCSRRKSNLRGRAATHYAGEQQRSLNVNTEKIQCRLLTNAALFLRLLMLDDDIDAILPGRGVFGFVRRVTLEAPPRIAMSWPCRRHCAQADFCVLCKVSINAEAVIVHEQGQKPVLSQ